MRIPAFWDTTALVPLCVRQGVTPGAIALYKVHDAVVWWATPGRDCERTCPTCADEATRPQRLD
jgi:hypothetical protein